MRRTTIERSQRTTLRLVLGGVGERASAYSPFGPVRAGLITTQRTNEDQVLTELLNSLERKITELSIKSCEVLNTYLSDTEHLVRHTSSFSNTDIIDSCDECGNDLVAEGQSKCLECLEKVMLLSNS
jgi:hypothetical protein